MQIQIAKIFLYIFLFILPAVPTTLFVFPKIMNLVYSVYFFNSCSVNTFRFPLFYFMNHHFTTTYRSKLNFSCCFLSLPLQKKFEGVSTAREKMKFHEAL